MRWRRLGRVFNGEGQFPWMASHAGQPFAEQVDGSLYRFYFTSRDRQSQSHVGWILVDIHHPNHVLRISEHPILRPGTPGSFDDAGAALSCVVRSGGSRYVYYIGWSLRRSVPDHLAIGLAVGNDGNADPRVTPLPGPIVDRSTVDPLFCTAPTVLTESGSWRMWYVSGIGWPEINGTVVPSYKTCFATSTDGINWHRSGHVALNPSGTELGFSRPAIIRERDGYAMWYAVRARDHAYQLGFARSADGLTWTRDDANAGLVVAAEGWDSEMIAYPHVFDHDGQRYMLYNGNRFGSTGFGIAVLDDDDRPFR
jgi:hypothetical protein